jgi:hypothetical protein
MPVPVQGWCGVRARVRAGFLQRRFLQKSFIVARDGSSLHANRTRLDDTIIPATEQYSNTGGGGEETKKIKMNESRTSYIHINESGIYVSIYAWCSFDGAFFWLL